MYQIYLEGKQLKRNQVTGMHLMIGFLLIGIGMVTWLVPDTVKQTALVFLNYIGLAYAILGFLIIIVCIFLNKRIIQTKANSILRIIEIIAMLLMLAFSIYKQWYLPIGYSAAALLGIIITYYLEKNHKKAKKAIFNEKGIHIPGLGSHKNTEWQDIKNIILKNNILTVDFKNNKLYQANLAKNNPPIDAEAFHNFTSQKMVENSSKYKADW